MRTVIQRVTKATVSINGEEKGTIKQGLVIFLGIEDNDNTEDINWLTKKIINLRIFNDENEVMNKSIIEINGEILLISQFTLYASTKKGNRPSYIKASKGETAIQIYEQFHKTLENLLNKSIKTGTFGADMMVELINDGPVTICIDTKNKE